MAKQRKSRSTKNITKSVLDNDITVDQNSSENNLWSSITKNVMDLGPTEAYLRIAPVRSAISKIAQSTARAKVRFFTKDNQEIVDGSLVRLFANPNRYQDTFSFTAELISWYLLCSEMAVLPDAPNPAAKPTGLMALNPLSLQIETPINPNRLEDVKLWRYCYPSGIQISIPASQIVFSKSFSAGSIRGVSSIVSGTNEINSYYQTVRYTRTFFENDTTPSLVVTMPAGIGAKQRDDFVEEWRNTFGTKFRGSFKTFFSSDGVEVQNIESQIQKSFAENIIKATKESIYEIFPVPPIISGNWSNAKYDSADAQLEMFADTVQYPILHQLSAMFQNQLVDPYQLYWKSDMVLKKDVRLSRNVRSSLSKSMEQYPGSDIYIVWDIDTLPFAAKIQQARIQSALKLMNEGRTSKRDAFDFYQIDIPDSGSPADTAVFISSSLKEYVPPSQSSPSPTTEKTDLPDIEKSNSSFAEEKSYTKEEREYASKISRFLIEYRKLALSNPVSLRLRHIDEYLSKICPNNDVMRDYSRQIFAQIKEARSTEQIKSIFNQIPKSRIREIAREYLSLAISQEPQE